MKRILIISILCLSALAAGVTAPESDDEGGFESKLNAGISLRDAEKRTVLANISILTEGEKPGLGSLRAGAEGNYGETTLDGRTDTTVKDAEAFVNARKTIQPMTFGYVESSILYDHIALVDYRVTVGPGAGAYMVKREDLSLSLEAGPSYIWEKVDAARSDYLAMRVAEYFDYEFSETARIWQSVEYLPRIDDFSNYLLKAEIGIEAAITTRANLRVVLKDKYDNSPGSGLKRNDLSLIAGIGVSL